MRIDRQVPGSVFLLLVAALGSSCANDSTPVSAREARIVNGQLTTGSPSTVMIQDRGGGGGFCSGTLITPHIVLTAGHCLQGSTADQNQVFFGSAEGAPGTAINVVHQLENPAADMGLMTLEEAGPATPVPAFFGDLAAHIGEPVHIVGFGSINEAGEGFGPKREGMTTLLSLQEDAMFTQTALSGPVSGTCYGDSGGPNYMTIGATDFVVGEIVSGTAECGMGQDISIRTDVYKDWIEGYIAEHETDAPSPPDAGPPDAAPAPDAAPPAPDAGGNGEDDDGGGCGCTVGGARGAAGRGSALLGLLLSLGFVVVRRRRA